MNDTLTLSEVLDDLARSTDTVASTTVDVDVERAAHLFRIADYLRVESRELAAGERSENCARETIAAARALLAPRRLQAEPILGIVGHGRGAVVKQVLVNACDGPVKLGGARP